MSLAIVTKYADGSFGGYGSFLANYQRKPEFAMGKRFEQSLHCSMILEYPLPSSKDALQQRGGLHPDPAYQAVSESVYVSLKRTHVPPYLANLLAL